MSPSVWDWPPDRQGLSVGFTTASVLVYELMEAPDDKQLSRFQNRTTRLKFVIIDELGLVPLSETGSTFVSSKPVLR